MLEPSGARPTNAPVLERACLVHTQHMRTACELRGPGHATADSSIDTTPCGAAHHRGSLAGSALFCQPPCAWALSCYLLQA